jgi:molecular chaperone HtpG
MLKGVIDHTITNVLCSGLQADSNVKKNFNYITRKVADKLKTFTENREDFEKMERYLKLF